MPYLTTIYRVFIASPMDVTKEREVIRSTILEWNSNHAATRHLMLEPVGWSAHAIPETGDRPQAIATKHILWDADLLIGVFWTRLGAATGSQKSGIVEKIEEHLRAGKPAMLFFSDTPVRPDSVDEAQYKALREFREKMQLQKGVADSFSTVEEFTQKLNRKLNRVLDDSKLFSGSESPTFLNSAPKSPPVPGKKELSEDALTVLIFAAKDNGWITLVRHITGVTVQAGKHELDTSTPRLTARWRSAVEELHQAGHIRKEGGYYQVSENGYLLCEKQGILQKTS